ncbi:MAG: cytochrome b562 [Verrucomicrobia bacterium]|nr:cytochrome b562 [Verrucomicrobiota bacterium]
MKIRTLLLSLICAAAVVPSVRAAEGKDKDETVLGNHMDKMGGAFRKLKRQISDATKNADSLTLVATIKAESAAAAKEKPAWHPEDAPKYQAQMKDFIALVDKLEAALKAGDNAAAAKLVEDLGFAQKKGHTDFKKPDEKKKKA